MTEGLGRANRGTVRKLFVLAIAMFGFGFALLPLYDIFCQITGLNGKTGRADASTVQASRVDTGRWVTVEFTGQVMAGLPWEFRAVQKKLRLHPGETVLVKYYARNMTAETLTGGAVPSVSPARAAAYFKKVECFCFNRQELKGGESLEMAVTFLVDRRLPKEVDTITLSYAFFNLDKAQRKKYAANAQ